MHLHNHLCPPLHTALRQEHCTESISPHCELHSALHWIAPQWFGWVSTLQWCIAPLRGLRHTCSGPHVSFDSNMPSRWYQLRGDGKGTNCIFLLFLANVSLERNYFQLKFAACQCDNHFIDKTERVQTDFPTDIFPNFDLIFFHRCHKVQNSSNVQPGVKIRWLWW